MNNSLMKFNPDLELSIVVACFNERDCIKDLCQTLVTELEKLDNCNFEIIVADNCSVDGSIDILRLLAKQDKRIKVLVANRNFGQIRNPFNALGWARGRGIVMMAADFQDPPSLVPEMVKLWRGGCEVVMAQKQRSSESALMFTIRKLYYRILKQISEAPLPINVTGFGIYDRKVISAMLNLNDPYPYGRGLVAELGYEITLLPFSQPIRLRGSSKNNFLSLFDYAVIGLTNHSRLPIRIVTLLGAVTSIVSFMVAGVYLALKLTFWSEIEMGVAPLIVGIFFVGGVQLLCLGVIGEYVGAIFSRLQGRPLAVIREALNFD